MSVSQSNLLEGKILAAKIQEDIKSAIAEFVAKGLEVPKLQVIKATDDPSAKWYVGAQEKLAKKLGIEFDDTITPDKVSDQGELVREIQFASEKGDAHGIFVTMPLPEGFDADEALLAMDPKKDVEGIHPTNLGLIVLRKAKLIPSTAYAAFQLIQAAGIKLRGARATIVGQSAIVGRPLQLLLGQERVTTVVCNTGTTDEAIQELVSQSDIVVACAGRPGIVKGDSIKEGAVVIDVGTTEVDGKLVGDVEFETAKARAGFITPVPGGVGPLTVTMLMQNLINAYRWQKGL